MVKRALSLLTLLALLAACDDHSQKQADADCRARAGKPVASYTPVANGPATNCVIQRVIKEKEPATTTPNER
jgi:hypothetical protein